uniref:NADH-plastoquinone oxidoreductase subunit 5 n=1 Tax=Epidendrum avicula TaxID=123163 RepID=A0AA96MQ11_9ASPA|nr:NADH-plastoquinone oxidoreductase subunit 5 [Epidendrum avicula]WNS59803.1 NADH-plastoquinone oxidoreductase subunit 5 [Epidendrum avicula]
MDNTPFSTSSYYVNSIWTSTYTYSDSNKRSSSYTGFPKCFTTKYSYVVFDHNLNLSIQQINGSLTYQYIWSWAIHNDSLLDFGHLIDPLTFIIIMSILITTVGIMVFIYSDN